MEFHLPFLIEKYNLNIRGVIQVGAHYGQETQIFLNAGINKIVLFEPTPDIFAKLESYSGSAAWCYNCALSNFNGEADFYVETVNQGFSSSLLKSKKHSEYHPHITFDNKIKVEVRQLDEFLVFAPFCNFLFLDVQGGELDVLKGAKEYLKHVDLIYTEINFEELYEGCGLVGDLDKFLKPYGFERVETVNFPSGDGDAVYIKK